MPDIIQIPVEATYRIINGEAVQIAAVYADVSADAVARFLIDAFHVPVNSDAETQRR